MSPTPNPASPAVYPVNDTTRSPAEREYLRHLAEVASKQDLTEDVRGYVRDISIAFTVFAAVFVLLRFVARWRQGARIAVDDWLIVAALAVLAGNMVMNLMLVQQGLGLHSGALTLPELQILDQTIVGAEIIYVTGVNLYKISLLFFYFRVFPVRSVRLGGWICGGISTAWNVACILAATFQCTPRERLWMPWLDGICINLFLTQLCISIPSILCDIAILCLPMPHVLRLKTNLWQRLLLMFIFLLGSYVVFTSIYRFRIFLLYTTDDVPYSLADGCAWNVIEISSGIVSACLPTLASFFLYVLFPPPHAYMVHHTPQTNHLSLTPPFPRCSSPLVRDIFKSAWPSTRSGGSHSARAHAPIGGGSGVGVFTIGGTPLAHKSGGGGSGKSTLSSQSSGWRRNRLHRRHAAAAAESDDDNDTERAGEPPSRPHSDSSRDDLELVPKHARGRVEVTVHASPEGSDEWRCGGGVGGRDDGVGRDEDGFPMDAIRQRRDVEWRVEERSVAGG